LLHKINTNERQQDENPNEVKRISFSLDGDMLAAACSKHSVLIYSLQKGSWQLTEELTGHLDCVFDVAWGKKMGANILASASHDMTSRVWKCSA